MTAGKYIKVHIYDTSKENRPEIKTRAYNQVFKVYEQGGRLGIDWNGFTPLDSFSTCNNAVEFEEVKDFEMWTQSEIDFFEGIGCRIDPKSDKVLISREQWKKEQYTDRSIYNKDIRTWMIPGCVLIFEHRHFEIV